MLKLDALLPWICNFLSGLLNPYHVTSEHSCHYQTRRNYFFSCVPYYISLEPDFFSQSILFFYIFSMEFSHIHCDHKQQWLPWQAVWWECIKKKHVKCFLKRWRCPWHGDHTHSYWHFTSRLNVYSNLPPRYTVYIAYLLICRSKMDLETLLKGIQYFLKNVKSLYDTHHFVYSCRAWFNIPPGPKWIVHFLIFLDLLNRKNYATIIGNMISGCRVRQEWLLGGNCGQNNTRHRTSSYLYLFLCFVVVLPGIKLV